MRVFVSHHAIEQQSLIPYTDREIVRAVQHFFPNSNSHLFGQDGTADARQFLSMKAACDDAEPMFSIDTTGQIPFHKLPFAVEQKKLTYLSDAPFGSLAALKEMPAGAYVGYSDRGFTLFYEDFAPSLQAVFLPHGGPLDVDRGKPAAERPLPLAFIGKIARPEPSGQFDHPILSGDHAVKAIFRKAAELGYEGGEEVYRAYRIACRDAGADPLNTLPVDDLCDVLWALQHWIEAHRRLDVLRAFSRRRIDIFGPVDDRIKGVTDAPHRFHGPITGRQALAVMQETRILLNAVFVLSGGSHERIWFALANGCLPCTDPSSFVQETLRDDDSMLFIDYDDLERTEDKVWRLAEDTDRLGRMLDTALPIYQAHHTWISRLRNAFLDIPELRPFIGQ